MLVILLIGTLCIFGCIGLFLMFWFVFLVQFGHYYIIINGRRFVTDQYSKIKNKVEDLNDKVIKRISSSDNIKKLNTRVSVCGFLFGLMYRRWISECRKFHLLRQRISCICEMFFVDFSAFVIGVFLLMTLEFFLVKMPQHMDKVYLYLIIPVCVSLHFNIS